MNGLFDIIFFAAFAVFIGYRLYNVLGRKDFSENQQKPAEFKGFSAPVQQPSVIDIQAEEVVVKDENEIIEKYGVKIASEISAIKKHESSFTIDKFIKGAVKAFEIIVSSFAKGDKEALKTLLSKDLYKGFSEAIDARNTKGVIEETTIVSILSSTVKDIVLNRKYAKIVVEIVSEQISLVKNKKGETIEGNPSKVHKISEVWTFGRELGSSNPGWELVATGSAG